MAVRMGTRTPDGRDQVSDFEEAESYDFMNDQNIQDFIAANMPDPSKAPARITPTPPEQPRRFQDFTPAEVRTSFDGIRANPKFSEALEADVQKTFVSQWIRQQAETMLDDYLNGSNEIGLISEAEIEARPDPEWWVEGLIQKNTIAVLAGSGGVGKTFLMLHLSRCIASGREAFIQRSTTKGRVLYVAAEGASAFGSRARAWNDYHHTAPPADGVVYVEQGVNLSSPASVAKLAEIVTQGVFDVIVLDTYSQLSNVDDENSAAKNALVFRNIKTLRDAREGASVVVVHHTDAAGKKARGSTAIRDNSDTVIMATKAGGDTFTLSTRDTDGGKQKDGKGQKSEGYQLVDHLTSAVVVQKAKPPHPLWVILYPILSDGAVHLNRDLRLACGIEETSGAAYEAYKSFIARMVKDGALIKSGPVNNPSYQLPAIAVS
jgi:hypothetical protein